ncbi:MAG: hypothetical protein MI975_14990 [Cytophagales bacterium]|nr:hypothetical protein [Cytophagales bacterium]
MKQVPQTANILSSISLRYPRSNITLKEAKIITGNNSTIVGFLVVAKTLNIPEMR